MGFALLWVMSYHFFGLGACETVGKALWSLGHAGVDIFFFLSGLGLTYSYYDRLDTKTEITKYYKKRIIRIIPAYYFVIIISAFIYQKGLTDVIWQLSCFGFWITKPFYDWYVPSLLLFYMCFPLFVILSNKYGIKKISIIAIILMLIIVGGLVYIGRGTVILFFSRGPILILGCLVGKILKFKDHIISKYVLSVLICLAVVVFAIELYLSCNFNASFLRVTALHHLPFVFVIPGLCFVLSYFFELLQKNVFLNWIVVALQFLGTYSLEIYLTHISLRQSPFYIYIPLAILLGFILNRIINIMNSSLWLKRK